MKKFEISNRISGHVLGIYEGADEEDALDTMARDAGYDDYEDCCKRVGGEGELRVEEVE